jgi:hypothetical protein
MFVQGKQGKAKVMTCTGEAGYARVQYPQSLTTSDPTHEIKKVKFAVDTLWFVSENGEEWTTGGYDTRKEAVQAIINHVDAEQEKEEPTADVTIEIAPDAIQEFVNSFDLVVMRPYVAAYQGTGCSVHEVNLMAADDNDALNKSMSNDLVYLLERADDGIHREVWNIATQPQEATPMQSEAKTETPEQSAYNAVIRREAQGEIVIEKTLTELDTETHEMFRRRVMNARVIFEDAPTQGLDNYKYQYFTSPDDGRMCAHIFAEVQTQPEPTPQAHTTTEPPTEDTNPMPEPTNAVETGTAQEEKKLYRVVTKDANSYYTCENLETVRATMEYLQSQGIDCTYFTIEEDSGTHDNSQSSAQRDEQIREHLAIARQHGVRAAANEDTARAILSDKTQPPTKRIEGAQPYIDAAQRLRSLQGNHEAKAEQLLSQ